MYSLTAGKKKTLHDSCAGHFTTAPEVSSRRPSREKEREGGGTKNGWDGDKSIRTKIWATIKAMGESVTERDVLYREEREWE